MSAEDGLELEVEQAPYKAFGILAEAVTFTLLFEQDVHLEQIKFSLNVHEYQKEVDDQNPDNKGYYRVLDVIPKTRSEEFITVLRSLREEYQQYCEPNWVVATALAADGSMLIVCFNPRRPFASELNQNES